MYITKINVEIIITQKSTISAAEVWPTLVYLGVILQ